MSDHKRAKLVSDKGAGVLDAEKADPGEFEGNGSADDGDIDAEDPALIEVLQLQERIDKITDEASDRVLAIEQEYTRKRRPVYQERGAKLRSIPLFWATALSNHATLATIITDADLDALRHTIELDVEDYDDIKSGYRITFTFDDDNPYFSNKQLTKEFNYAEDASLTIRSTEIQWRQGMEPEEPVQQVGRKRVAPTYGFFLWFTDEYLEPGSHDQVAEIIKEHIWPSPVKYYTGSGTHEGEELGDVAEGLGEGEEAVVFDEGEEEYEQSASAEYDDEQVAVATGDDAGAGA